MVLYKRLQGFFYVHFFVEGLFVVDLVRKNYNLSVRFLFSFYRCILFLPIHPPLIVSSKIYVKSFFFLLNSPYRRKKREYWVRYEILYTIDFFPFVVRRFSIFFNIFSQYLFRIKKLNGIVEWV